MKLVEDEKLLEKEDDNDNNKININKIPYLFYQ